MGHIRKMTNKDPNFYPILGPFLSRREIAKASGNPIWDDDGNTWYVATDDSGKVQGFAALRPQAKGADVVSDYVLPEFEETDVREAILLAQIDDRPGALSAVVKPAVVALHEKHGFTAVGTAGSYTRMRRDPK